MSSEANIIDVVGEITFKVAVNTSLVSKISSTQCGKGHLCSGSDNF